jgi:hypothetical protein
MKTCFHSLLAALCAVSCIYPYQPDISREVSQTVVVDGKILVGGTSIIQVGYLQPLDGYSWETNPVADAWVEDDLGNRYPSSGKNYASGYLYIPTDTPQALSASSFRAVVQVDGETYVSDWTTPDPAPVINDIHFGSDNDWVYVWADMETPLDNPGYMGFMIEETWEFHADYYPMYYVNTDTWQYELYEEFYPYYWCWRTYAPMNVVLANLTQLHGGLIRNIPITTFGRMDNRNHRRYSILVKAFALSKEAYQFNQQLQEMANMGGSLFTPDPGALEGNLVCESDPTREVMGMVLSGRVATRRVFLDSQYLITRQPSYPKRFIEEKSDFTRFYYDMKYRPIEYVDVEGVPAMAWGPERCINCIVAGGTQQKPDFWD